MSGNIGSAVHNRTDASVGDSMMRAIAPVFLALVLALTASGCDKCGDYFWQNGTKSCHDQSQVK
jgi:hypothetical protein